MDAAITNHDVEMLGRGSPGLAAGIKLFGEVRAKQV